MNLPPTVNAYCAGRVRCRTTWRAIYPIRRSLRSSQASSAKLFDCSRRPRFQGRRSSRARSPHGENCRKFNSGIEFRHKTGRALRAQVHHQASALLLRVSANAPQAKPKPRCRPVRCRTEVRQPRRLAEFDASAHAASFPSRSRLTSFRTYFEKSISGSSARTWATFLQSDGGMETLRVTARPSAERSGSSPIRSARPRSRPYAGTRHSRGRRTARDTRRRADPRSAGRP